MKTVRYLALAVIGLIVLALAAIAVAIAVIDPNDYKPQIEKAVEDTTNLDLILEGEIGWSFIPLGLELNGVEATLENDPLVRLERLIAQVDFWSLITLSPQVNTFVLDGLNAHLVVDQQGNGNWTRIMPQSDEAVADSVPSTERPAPAAEAGIDTETETETADAGAPLNFNVESVQVTNASVLYNDKSSGQSVTLENVSLSASEITLGKGFPMEMAFRFATSQPEFAVDGSLRADLDVNQALNRFAMANLNSRFALSGEPFGNKTVQAVIKGGAVADLENETAAVNDLTVTLANLELTSNLNVTGFGDTPELSGNLNIARFSLKKLLEALGQPAIETTDPDVLKALALSMNVNGPAGQVNLDNLSITVDDTTFAGNARYTLANSAIALDLQGDTFNVDRYLPPAAEDEAQTGDNASSPSTPTETATSTEEGDLLPLDTLRTLALDIKLGLGELVASNLTINDLKAVMTANNGVLKVNELSGKLYEGGFNANATLDARTDNPTWSIGSRVNNVQTLPLLTDLAEVDLLAGGANLNIDLKTAGNRISALRNNAKGDIGFNLAEGEFTRMNLTRMACQGVALANQDTLATTGWGTSTPFNDMRGTLKVDGNTLTNTDLVAALAGMKLEGNGTVDLAASALDYEAGLRIIGEIHRDEACRVTEYVENVVIPVECRGDFAEDPAGLCSFDGSRFRDTLKTIAANAARAKAQEEVERARGRAEERVTEELERRLDSEEAEQVKDALKGLFGR
ncbi:AsmA family protein [Marinobacter sp. SS21]|uniref:AsmA family protein n=1 Tax=Marinobacter sp. SS21 TaxID=2979460 RepID=UPI00232EFC56|nr:AsmA family protein [Marinobacter sp. SS21]MDC0663726.1 AsmA family protein [Marinobacter sp. SS21]